MAVRLRLWERMRVFGQALLCGIPRRLVDDGVVLALVDVEVVLLDHAVHVALALDGRCPAKPEGDFSGIHRVAYDVLHGAWGEVLILAVAAYLLAVSLRVEP